MNARETARRTSLIPRIVTLALGALAFEGTPSRAQNIGQETQFVEGLRELERVAEAEVEEALAFRVVPSRITEGRFVDLQDGNGIERSAAEVRFSSSDIARRIDELYRTFPRRERGSRIINVVVLHTHTSAAIRTFAPRISPLLETAVNRNLPLTVPPSITDVINRTPSSSVIRNILGALRYTPSDRVRFQGVVVDETMTYLSHSLSESERTYRGLGEFRLFTGYRSHGGEVDTPTEQQFNKVRSQWAFFVGEARTRGESWDAILHSREYSDLQDFYARHYNTALVALPNEELTAETLEELGYR